MKSYMVNRLTRKNRASVFYNTWINAQISKILGTDGVVGYSVWWWWVMVVPRRVISIKRAAKAYASYTITNTVLFSFQFSCRSRAYSTNEPIATVELIWIITLSSAKWLSVVTLILKNSDHSLGPNAASFGVFTIYQYSVFGLLLWHQRRRRCTLIRRRYWMTQGSDNKCI